MKILIVDDDVVSRMVLMHLIDSAGLPGCDVVEAEDGEDAWRQLEAGPAPAMLFCDLRMPHLSGMELLARIKADARFAGLPFVLASAAGDAATMEQALGLGADAYIVKPFDAAKVAPQLARLRPVDDDPQASARRLGIDIERLSIYLGGLQRQLAAAEAEIDALLAGAQPDAARTALARLAEGCRTLGLHGAAAGIAALSAAPALDGGAIAQALATAQQAVLHQLDAVRT